PFSIAASSAPIVALAPITNQWFGITNPVSKMTVVAVMVFFPVMINMVRGLTDVDVAKLELMKSVAAPDYSTLVKVRLPNALPYLFSALKVAIALSLIGAIVSEYFGGSRNALGIYISQQAALTRMAEAWAGIVVAIILGAGMQLVLVVIERRVMPWHASRQTR
ncbi:MAG: ABC transporter permease subunit, partial [Acidimicrobiia bacterium]